MAYRRLSRTTDDLLNALRTDPVPGTITEVLTGQTATAYASELGSEENLFLMVFNPDEVNDGEWEIEVVE